MKKISIVLMAVCFALSANAFAGTKHHSKHMHHAKKAAMAAPATTPAAAPASATK